MLFHESAATAVLIIHVAFIGFVVLGGLLVARLRWMAALHLPAAAWGVLVEATGWGCPLTALENTLRIRAGMARYEGDFIEQCLLGLIYPEGMTRAVQLILAGGVIVLNALIYAWIFYCRRGVS